MAQLPVFPERNDHCGLVAKMDDLMGIIGVKLGHGTMVDGYGGSPSD